MDEISDQCALEHTPEPLRTSLYEDRTGVETTSGTTVLPQDLGIGRLFESVMDTVIVTDARTGRIVLWNPAAAETFGYLPSEALGMSVERLVPEYPKPRPRSGTTRYLDTGYGPHIDPGTVLELTAVGKDGGETEVEMTLSPIAPTDSASRERYVLAIMRDVTERKRKEEEIGRLREGLEERVAGRTAELEAALAGLRERDLTLREGEERFRILVEGTRDYAIFMLDPEGRVASWNAGAERNNGYKADEIIGENFSIFYTEEDVERGHPEEELRIAAAEGRYEEEGWRVRKDGATFWASVVITALRDEEGNLRGFSEIVRDVTEQKKAQDDLRRSEERFRSLVQNSQDVITVTDPDGKVLYRSPSVEQVMGYKPEELLGKDVLEAILVHPEDLPHVRRVIDDALDNPGVGHDLELRIRHADGSWRIIESTVMNLIDNPDVGGIVYNYRDITERKQAEERIRWQADLLDLSQEPIFAWEPEGGIAYWNRGSEELYGFSKEEALGRVGHELLRTVHPMGPEEFEAMLQREGQWVGELEHTTRDGRKVTVESRHMLVDTSDGRSLILETNRDVTERKILERQLKHRALHDPLTGLPNRVLLLDRLEHALARLGRRDSSVAVLFLDLDDFKVVNDSLGHEAGDTLLVEVAGRLKDCLRGEDTLARLGGDEFTVLLEEVADASEALLVAERIVRAFASPFHIAGREVFASCSVGVSLSASGQSQPQELLRDADVAMYQAKANGKAHHAVYDPDLGARARARLELESDLRRALAEGELRVHYQPKVRLGSNRVAGMEALVRWEHPERGLIPPSEFVPLAEESGLILPVGRWVLQEACRQAKEWQKRYPAASPLPISVNLSARQFRHGGLVEDVAWVLRETGLKPSCLELEVTESAVMDDVESAIATMRKLKGLGVGLSMDDFGTGHSSLNYLRRFPVDELKIDKSFVDGLGREEKGTAIMRAMTMLASALGLTVVAEGVEDAEQLACLRDLECDLVQGYYFARPLTSEDASALLASGSSFDH